MVRGLTCTRWVSWLSQGSAAASLAGSHTRIPLHTPKDSNWHTVKKICPDEAFDQQVIVRSLRSHQVLLSRGWWQGIFVQFSEERSSCAPQWHLCGHDTGTQGRESEGRGRPSVGTCNPRRRRRCLRMLTLWEVARMSVWRWDIWGSWNIFTSTYI